MLNNLLLLLAGRAGGNAGPASINTVNWGGANFQTWDGVFLTWGV